MRLLYADDLPDVINKLELLYKENSDILSVTELSVIEQLKGILSSHVINHVALVIKYIDSINY